MKEKWDNLSIGAKLLLKGEAMIECAEDNFWTALGSVVEIGGLYLILAFVIAPILIGWLLPSPTKFKGRA